MQHNQTLSPSTGRAGQIGQSAHVLEIRIYSSQFKALNDVARRFHPESFRFGRAGYHGYINSLTGEAGSMRPYRVNSFERLSKDSPSRNASLACRGLSGLISELVAERPPESPPVQDADWADAPRINRWQLPRLPSAFPQTVAFPRQMRRDATNSHRPGDFLFNIYHLKLAFPEDAPDSSAQLTRDLQHCQSRCRATAR